MLLALPLILIAAFELGSSGEPGTGPRSFVDLAQQSGANLTVFALFASTGFLLIVVVALFAGDTVPSEASWSSLRYLLAAPVPRERLIRQKLIVAGVVLDGGADLPAGLVAAGRRHRVRVRAVRRDHRRPDRLAGLRAAGW